MFKLKKLYKNSKRVVVTAHRGFSGQYPENTLLAFEEAVKLGVDIIEFDLRGTKDNVPIVLHDTTIDQTTNSTGKPSQYMLKELQQFNASCWVKTTLKAGDVEPKNGYHIADGRYSDVRIPTFEEVLQSMPENVGFNIHVKEAEPALLKEICTLYDEYDVYSRGYLSIGTFKDAEAVRVINPEIELCMLEKQGQMNLKALKEQKAFGCTYIQPGRADVNSDFCQTVKDLGLYANMYYSNTVEDNRRYIGYGLQGILTDYPDLLLQTVKDMGLH